MEQLAHDDIVAAAAAHHELGRDYDGAVAESLVERIGAEIDKRVDARFAAKERGGSHPADVTQPDQRHTLLMGIMIGSAVSGVPLIMIASSASAVLAKDGLQFLLVLWLVLAVAAVWAARAVRARRQPPSRRTQ